MGYPKVEDVINKHSDNFWHSKNNSKNDVVSRKEYAGWRGELIALKSTGAQFDVLASLAIVKSTKKVPDLD